MGDYTGGYTSAINDASQRRYRDQQTQLLLQTLTQKNIDFQQAQQQREEQVKGFEEWAKNNAIQPPPSDTPPGLSPSSLAMFGPTPQGGPPSPAPGAASMPTQGPPPPMGAPVGPAPQPQPPTAGPPPGAAPPMQPNAAQNAVDPAAHALMQMLAKHGPATVKVDPAGQISTNQQPPGWKPSPVAGQALGGQPPGAAPAGPGPAQIGAPPAPQAGGADGGFGGQMIDPRKEVGKMVKDGLTPHQAAVRAMAMLPVWNEMNKSVVQGFAQQTKIADLTVRTQNALMRATELERKAGGAGGAQPQKTAFVKDLETFLDSHTPPEEKAYLKKRLDKDVAPTAANAPAQGGGLSDGAVDLAASQYLATGQMPPLGFSSQALRTAILNRAAILQAQTGEDTSTVPGKRAEFKAGSTALTQVTKDLTSIAPYQAMLEKNADIAITLAEKVSKSNLPLANKSINWLEKNAAGDPDTAEYLAQIRIVQTEAARVLNNPRLVGQLTDSARHEMEGIIDGSLTLAQTKSVLSRLKADGQNRVNAMKAQSSELRASLGASGGGTPTATGSKIVHWNDLK